MAASLGRKATFIWQGEAVATFRELSVTVNGEAVDISDGASDGWRELLDEPGEKSVDIDVSGLIKNDRWKDIIFNGTRMGPASILYPDGGLLSGTFYLGNLKDGLPYKESLNFECKLQSSGEVTYSAAP